MLPTHSAGQIALFLGGVSRNAVIGKARRLGLRSPPRQKDRGPPRPIAISVLDEIAPVIAAPATLPRVPRTLEEKARRSEKNRRDRARAKAARTDASSAPIVEAVPIPPPVLLPVLEAPEPILARLEQDVVAPLSLRVTIAELKETMCKWPLGDPRSSEFRYCGSPSPGASPYCTHHDRLAYYPRPERRGEPSNRFTTFA
jgi:GcrA cell cycle regulator